MRRGFTGAKFKPPVVLAPKPKVEEPTLKFPIEVRVAGVTMGARVCMTCAQAYQTTNVSICSSCGSSFFSSYRQMMLGHAYAQFIGIAHLRPEPENKYDPKAVAVYLNISGEMVHIGYLPAGGNGKEVPVTAAEIFDYLKTKTLWVKCKVIGGPQENDSSKSYGLILWLHDTPPGIN